jgi:hypothetical protein
VGQRYAARCGASYSIIAIRVNAAVRSDIACRPSHSGERIVLSLILAGSSSPYPRRSRKKCCPLRGGDRWFESCSLQRGVCCEPYSLDRVIAKILPKINADSLRGGLIHKVTRRIRALMSSRASQGMAIHLLPSLADDPRNILKTTLRLPAAVQSSSPRPERQYPLAESRRVIIDVAGQSRLRPGGRCRRKSAK